MKIYRVEVPPERIGQLGEIVLLTRNGEQRHRWMFQTQVVEFPHFDWILDHRVEWI